MRTYNRNGFTLLEIMIVVAILGVVAAIAIPAYNGYIKTGHQSECQNEMASIQLAEAEYFLDNNSYFSGTGVSNLKSASGDIYSPSSTASGAKSECTYKVDTTTTTFTITASPKAGGHLVGQGDMIISGP